jgi:hypothetical protein
MATQKNVDVQGQFRIELERLLKQNSLGERYYHGSIPTKKQQNIMRFYSIPSNEKIIGVLDYTVRGSAKSGIVFGAEGLYWRKTMGSSGSLSYRRLLQVRIEISEDGHQIRFVDDKRVLNISVSEANIAPQKFLELLLDIREAYKPVLADKAKSTHRYRIKILTIGILMFVSAITASHLFTRVIQMVFPKLMEQEEYVPDYENPLSIGDSLQTSIGSISAVITLSAAQYSQDSYSCYPYTIFTIENSSDEILTFSPSAVFDAKKGSAFRDDLEATLLTLDTITVGPRSEKEVELKWKIHRSHSEMVIYVTVNAPISAASYAVFKDDSGMFRIGIPYSR